MKSYSYKNTVKVHIKKPHFHTNVFSMLWLKWQGKRDGKTGIPQTDSAHDEMTPNIKKEHDRIYSYMAYVIKKIDVYNAIYCKDLQSLITNFNCKVENIKVLYELLKDKPSDICLYIPKMSVDIEFEAYLSSKRDHEKSLDEMALRQRRFDEYQQKLEKYRKKYATLRTEIDDLYVSIMICYDIIKNNINIAKPMFWKASSEIDIRLSWYWQGVVLKHKYANKLSSTAPDPDSRKYEEYYNRKIEVMKEQIDSVILRYNYIIELK